MKSNAVLSVLVFIVSIAIALVAVEILLRLKNSSMKNYDIEMWRYAKLLKVKSDDPMLGHEHVKDGSAILQSVTIRTNEYGLRGGPLKSQPVARRIIFLGGSITLGWGVAEEETLTAQLEAMLQGEGESVEVLNAGVGNYNAERYVERYMRQLKDIKVTDIVVQYFLRDAEALDPGGGNILLRNSELAVTAWIVANRLMNREGENALTEHYKRVYEPDQPGFLAMRRALKRLSDHCKSATLRCYLAMTPDFHNLKDYPFGYVHERMKATAKELAYVFVDLLPGLGKLPPSQLWAMPGDPHPNALGHRLMAETLLPVLREKH